LSSKKKKPHWLKGLQTGNRQVAAHVALLVTSLMALVAVGTIIVDPYFVFGRSGIGGFNEIRVDAVDYPAVSKLYSVNNNAPRTLIFGSSLAQIGLERRLSCQARLQCRHARRLHVCHAAIFPARPCGGPRPTGDPGR
jgi:hypothetical protein